MNAPVKPRIERTSAGLRDALFDAIERLRDGDILADDAKATASLAKEICNTVNLEMAVARLRLEYPADTKMLVPSHLPLCATEKGTK